MLKVKKILEKWLKQNGYDGLCNENCGCIISDLIPCREGIENCSPGHREKVTKEMKDKDMDGVLYGEAEVGDWVVFCGKKERKNGN